MKKFNLAKGIITALLALVLVLGCSEVVKAKADTNNVTFKTTIDGTDYTWEKAISYKSAKSAAWMKGDTASNIVVKNGGNAVTPANGTTYRLRFVAAVADDPSTEDVNEAVAAHYEIVGQTGYTAEGSDCEDGITIKYRAASEVVAQSIDLSEVLDKLGKEAEALIIKTDAAPVIPDGKGSFANDKFSITSEEAFEITITTKVPKVTFTVTVTDMIGTGTDAETGTYTFEAGTEFQKKDKSMPLATVLAEMKTSADATLNDPAAWILFEDPNGGNDYEVVNSKSFKLKKNLEGDVTIALQVTNSKVPVTFKFKTDYKAVFYVDNKAYTNNATAPILFSDIVLGLKKTNAEGAEEGLEGESVILPDAFAAANSSVTGKYSGWKYLYTQAAITKTKPSEITIAEGKLETAFEKAAYDPASDSLVFVSKVPVTINWADVKKAAGANLASSAFKALDTKLDTVADSTTKDKYIASIPLYDKGAGVNNAVTKGTYIYATINAPAEGKQKVKYSANYVVDPTPFKKIAVSLDYAEAKKLEFTPAKGAVTRFTATTSAGKSTVYVRDIDEDAEDNPEDWALIWRSLQYSTDGTTWRSITGNALVKGKSVDFTTGMLYNLVTGGTKTTIYFRVCGDVAHPEDAVNDTPAKNAYRASKPVKVSVAAAKTGKALKVDVTKNAIALKNGYDFAVGDNDKGYTELGYTILPFNKEGKSMDEESGEPISIISTTAFVPVKKPAEDATMFTKEKIKSVPLSTIMDYSTKSITDATIYIYVRTSATVAKPASTWTLVKIAGQTAGPSLTATKGKFAIQDEKGALLIPAAKKAGSDKTSAAGYEFLIVDEADAEDEFAGVDFSTAKWSKLVEGKTIVVGKTSSKYGKDGGKATAHVLKDGSKVLIRRVGDKSSNTLASQYTVTKVVKDTVQVEVEDADGKKTKEEKELFVWVAD